MGTVRSYQWLKDIQSSYSRSTDIPAHVLEIARVHDGYIEKGRFSDEIARVLQHPLRVSILRPVDGSPSLQLIEDQSSALPEAIKLAKSMSNTAERYWRAVRRGDDQVSVVTLNPSSPSNRIERGLAFSSAMAMLATFYPPMRYKGPAILAGLSLGYLTGEDSTPPTISQSSVPRRLAFPGFDSLSLTAPTIQTSVADLELWRLIIARHAQNLSLRTLLTQPQIRELLMIRQKYGPPVHELVDILLRTKYDQQGACVVDGSCDKHQI
jgi:hypothetical protein